MVNGGVLEVGVRGSDYRLASSCVFEQQCLLAFCLSLVGCISRSLHATNRFLRTVVPGEVLSFVFEPRFPSFAGDGYLSELV